MNELKRQNTRVKSEAEHAAKNFVLQRDEFERAQQAKVQRIGEIKAELEEEKERRSILQDQLFEMKKKVASSTSFSKQLSDERLVETMSYTFATIHDCFLNATWGAKFGKLC